MTTPPVSGDRIMVAGLGAEGAGFRGQRFQEKNTSQVNPCQKCLMHVSASQWFSSAADVLAQSSVPSFPGVNTSAEHAKALVSLVKGQPADTRRLLHINVLRWPPMHMVQMRAACGSIRKLQARRRSSAFAFRLYNCDCHNL